MLLIELLVFAPLKRTPRPQNLFPAERVRRLLEMENIPLHTNPGEGYCIHPYRTSIVMGLVLFDFYRGKFSVVVHVLRERKHPDLIFSSMHWPTLTGACKRSNAATGRQAEVDKQSIYTPPFQTDSVPC